MFENVLLPVGKEYGLSATYEEYKEYIGSFAGTSDSELSENELAQWPFVLRRGGCNCITPVVEDVEAW